MLFFHSPDILVISPSSQNTQDIETTGKKRHRLCGTSKCAVASDSHGVFPWLHLSGATDTTDKKIDRDVIRQCAVASDKDSVVIGCTFCSWFFWNIVHASYVCFCCCCLLCFYYFYILTTCITTNFLLVL